jgi:6-phosphogluconolactonase (cycloisomerase 2 family)
VDPTTGALTSLGADIALGSATSLPAARFPVQVAIDPTGSFLFTANSSDNSINQFVLNKDGTLTGNGLITVASASYPWTFAFARVVPPL